MQLIAGMQMSIINIIRIHNQSTVSSDKYILRVKNENSPF